MKKHLIVFVLFLALLFVSTKSAYAYLASGPAGCDTTFELDDCSNLPPSTECDAPMQACADDGQVPNNVCCQPGQPCSPTWNFTYATGCKVQLGGTLGQCSLNYFYTDYKDCAAVDRCDTGYSRASFANRYKVYSGQCNAGNYDPSVGPSSACTTGGWYKTCCTGEETSADPTPLGWCEVIPYTRTCNPGSPTVGLTCAVAEEPTATPTTEPTAIPTDIPVCTPTSSCPTSPPSGLSPNGATLTPRTTVTLSWNAVTNADWYDVRVDGEGASIVAGQSGGDITDNCTPHDICKDQWGDDQNEATAPPTSMQITVQNGKGYSWWVHAGGSDGCQNCDQTTEGTASFGIGVPPPTPIPTLIPTLTPTSIPTPTLGPNSVSVSPSTNTQTSSGAWQQFSITKRSDFQNTSVNYQNGAPCTLTTCDPDSGWTPLCTFTTSGLGSCTWTPPTGTSISGAHTFGLFNSDTGALLAVANATFVPFDAPTPIPTTGPSGCSLTATPNEFGPSGGSTRVSLDPTSPAGTYDLTCPNSGKTTLSPGQSFDCTVPAQIGDYTASATKAGVSCSARVTVSQGCDELWRKNIETRVFVADLDDNRPTTTTVDGTTYKNPYPSCFETCQYTTGDDPYRQCGISCSYSHQGFGGLIVHATPRNPICGATEVTAITDEFGHARLNVIAAASEDNDIDPTKIDYDVWAEIPSGRPLAPWQSQKAGSCFKVGTNHPVTPRLLRIRHILESGAKADCNWRDNVITFRRDEQGRYHDRGDTLWAFFGYTNQGTQPVCTGLGAVPESGFHPLRVDFTAIGYDSDGPETIVGYDWDFRQGGAIIDRSTTTSTTNYTYNEGGQSTARVYLRDEDGLRSNPTEACQEVIDVLCRDLTIVPNPVTMAPGQTETLTISETDGDPEQIVWENNSFANGLLDIIGASGEVWCTRTEDDTSVVTDCSNPQAEEQKARGSWINISALKEGAAGLQVIESGTPGCEAQSKNVQVNVRIPPWFQGTGGDMRIDAGFNDSIPASVPVNSRYASLEGSGSTPGVVFSGNGTPEFGDGQASSSDWVLSGSDTTFKPVSSGVIRTSYSYMTTTAKQSGITPKPLTTGDLPTENGVYLTTGDLTLTSDSGTYRFPVGKNFVILVNGNLTIAENIIVPQSSTVTFSVKGNITVDESIGGAAATACDPATHAGCHIEGFYSADGDFVIDGNGKDACSTIVTTDDDKRVNFAGALVANAKLLGGVLDNQRDLCGTNNASNPTYTVTERPDMILNAPEFIKAPNSIWQEVAP